MDNFVDERDFKILENDKCTFFVLRRIIKEKCELLLTDHERLVICFSDKLCPVWIWTPDDASKEEMERAYQIASEHSMLQAASLRPQEIWHLYSLYSPVLDSAGNITLKIWFTRLQKL